jgi:hypothetical protein
VDNNRIDNDIVSVYLDDSVLVKRLTLSATPYSVVISLSGKNVPQHLKIAVESTGEEPPCTALIIISTRTERTVLEVATTFTENTAVEISLK